MFRIEAIISLVQSGKTAIFNYHYLWLVNQLSSNFPIKNMQGPAHFSLTNKEVQKGSILRVMVRVVRKKVWKPFNWMNTVN